MSLNSGSRTGHYEVTTKIGEGPNGAGSHRTAWGIVRN